MGKSLRQQKAGKGTLAYRRPSHRFKSEATMRAYDDVEKTGVMFGEVVGFVDDPARGPLLMDVLFENSERRELVAPEGAMKGSKIEVGAKAGIEFGNALPLTSIPDGTPIYNIELTPGDGGRFVRSSGASAVIVSRDDKHIYIKMPSKKTVLFDPRCRAQVGIICGGGRLDMPLMTAGAAHYKHHALNRRWPHNRGVKMSVYNHPFGGKQHHKGKSSCVSHGAPPGRKVGHIGARSMGRRKSRTKE